MTQVELQVKIADSHKQNEAVKAVALKMPFLDRSFWQEKSVFNERCSEIFSVL